MPEEKEKFNFPLTSESEKKKNINPINDNKTHHSFLENNLRRKP